MPPGGGLPYNVSVHLTGTLDDIESALMILAAGRDTSKKYPLEIVVESKYMQRSINKTGDVSEVVSIVRGL